MESETAKPSVTVIIATYNRSAVLPFSIGSVLRQTFTDFEVLVVGDGCTDDSQAVVESIHDQRVRWINLPTNSGHQSAPNNEGLKHSRGELIAYLGHDDLWLPHHLNCLTSAIANGSDLAYSVVGMVDVEGSSEVSITYPLKYESGTWIPPTGVLHRRAATEAVGGWRNYRDLFVDPEVDLWKRIHDADYRLTLVPRLTAIKFPGAFRRDVYQIRPCAEQSHWTQRILNEADFEATELVNILMPILEQSRLHKKHILYRDIVRQFISQTYQRALVRLSFNTYLESKTKTKGEEVDRLRKFKGLA